MSSLVALWVHARVPITFPQGSGETTKLHGSLQPRPSQGRREIARHDPNCLLSSRRRITTTRSGATPTTSRRCSSTLASRSSTWRRARSATPPAGSCSGGAAVMAGPFRVRTCGLLFVTQNLVISSLFRFELRQLSAGGGGSGARPGGGTGSGGAQDALEIRSISFTNGYVFPDVYSPSGGHEGTSVLTGGCGPCAARILPYGCVAVAVPSGHNCRDKIPRARWRRPARQLGTACQFWGLLRLESIPKLTC